MRKGNKNKKRKSLILAGKIENEKLEEYENESYYFALLIGQEAGLSL